jgi:hypothetical protein
MSLHHVQHGDIGTVGLDSGNGASGFTAFASFTTFASFAAFTTGRKVAERSPGFAAMGFTAFTAVGFTTLTTMALAAFATVMLAFFTALCRSLFTTFATLVFATLTAVGFTALATVRTGGHHFVVVLVTVLVSDGAGACQQCRNTDSGPEFHFLIGHRVLLKQAARAYPMAVRLMVVPWWCMMR